MTEAPYRMLIGGELVAAADGASMPSVNPTTEEVIAEFPAAGAADVDQAVQAATTAAPAWRDQGWERRADVLRRLAHLVRAHEREFAELDALDGGNPADAMVMDARRAAESLDYFAGVAGEAKGTTFVSRPDVQVLTVREPYGAVGRILPFNHPFQFVASKIAAPIAAGNAVVVKPAEQTSLSALRFGELIRDVVPPGVVNIVTGHGREAGEAVVRHPGLPRIAFTGSSATGIEILRAAADEVKEVSLELGGKNPMIVFPDVDIDKAVAASIGGMNFSRCQGQSCQSTSRLFVHRSVLGPFLDGLKKGVENLVVGNPLEAGTDMGPLAFERHFESVNGFIATAEAEGATLLTGGGRPEHLPRGYFVQPTVFADVTPDMTVSREEIFGPVLSVFAWDDFDEVVALANAAEYALTANIWTKDLAQAMRAARAVEAGYLWINGTGRRETGAPFGGFKHSGIGKESSLEELLSYTRERTVEITYG